MKGMSRHQRAGQIGSHCGLFRFPTEVVLTQL